MEEERQKGCLPNPAPAARITITAGMMVLLQNSSCLNRFFYFKQRWDMKLKKWLIGLLVIGVVVIVGGPITKYVGTSGERFNNLIEGQLE
ncbi:MAG: hypothetical protein GY866_15075 [Proteobacteria bacterium]|nr:hypothetical protein [Pseudomonadota bacterium]